MQYACTHAHFRYACFYIVSNDVAQVSGTNALVFDPTLKFSFQIDPVDATMIHFRMDGTTPEWISVMISAGSFMTGDSMTAYTNAAGAWVLEDQTGHPYSAAMSDVAKGGRDDLLNKLVWPVGGGVAATWSRKLNTGDAVADKIITNGTFCVCFVEPHEVVSSWFIP